MTARKKIKTGDVIKIEDLVAQGALQRITDTIQGVKQQLERLAEIEGRVAREMWEVIFNECPEAEPFRCTYNHQEQSIEVKEKK